MARPGSGGGESTPKGRLIQRISRWEQMNERLKYLHEQLEQNGGEIARQIQERINRLERRRNEVGGNIRELVKRHPRLYDYAIDQGFDNFGTWRPNATDGGSGGGSGGDGGGTGGSTGGGGSSDGSDGNRDGGNRSGNQDGGNDPGGNRNLLPGKRGKDYHLVRYNGRVYAVYRVKVRGRTINLAWRIDKPGVQGVNPDAARGITKEQFRNLNVFGPASDIARGKHGDLHPFKKFIRNIQEQYPNALLKNREVMSVLLMGFIEGKNAQEMKNLLQKTKWWQNHTALERRWLTEYSDKDREQAIEHWGGQIRQGLRDLFGGGKIPRWIDRKEIRNWAEKIASGAWSATSIEEGYQDWFARMQRKAERIEGTPAWIAKQTDKREERDFLNQPENMYEYLRQQSIEALGYAGRPDNDTLKKWANRLVSKKYSVADFNQWLRTRKEALYPFLDPDESYMDRASSYKAIAEELLGKPMSFQDKLLRDLTKPGANGEPTPYAMSFGEFQQQVRADKRYWSADNAQAAEQVYGFANFMNSMFNGAGGASGGMGSSVGNPGGGGLDFMPSGIGG